MSRWLKLLYFSCFVAMCRRVCRVPTKPDGGRFAGHGTAGRGRGGRPRVTRAPPAAEPPDLPSAIEPITEERASRTLYRIELLRKIREQVLRHPQLAERLRLCQPSLDLPEWWECGRHDRDLLVGAAKHGVSRTDYHILNDPELSFLDAHKTFAQTRGAAGAPALSALALGFGQTPASAATAVPTAAPGQEEKAGGAEAKAGEAGEAEAEEEEAEGGGKDRKQDREAEAEPGAGKSDPRGAEVGADMGPKSISEKGSEEDEEEKLEDDDKSEESSQPEGNSWPFRPLLTPSPQVSSCHVTGALFFSRSFYKRTRLQ